MRPEARRRLERMRENARARSFWPKILENDAGEEIATTAQWEARRNEIKNHLQDKIFGYFPKDLAVEFKSVLETNLSSIEATYRHVEISFPSLNTDRKIHLGLFYPKNIGDRKLPVFLSVNKCGNHTIVKDEIIPQNKGLPHHAVYCEGKTRGSLQDSYPVDQILEAGYIFATFDKSDMDADNASLLDDGIKSLIQTHSDPNRSWGTIAAWAFGLTKAVDWLHQDSHVDTNKIAVTGHSRRGKAALLAAAMDERIDMAIPHQSGLGGTARYRRAYLRESAKMMTQGHFVYQWMNEPHSLQHFFSKEFANWSERIGRLPIDAHHVIGLIAPRPFMDVQGTHDFWAGPRSSRRMVELASKVYRLYGVEVGSDLQINDGDITSENSGQIIQFTSRTGHVANRFYWSKFIQFADSHFKTTNAPSSPLESPQSPQ